MRKSTSNLRPPLSRAKSTFHTKYWLENVLPCTRLLQTAHICKCQINNRFNKLFSNTSSRSFRAIYIRRGPSGEGMRGQPGTCVTASVTVHSGVFTLLYQVSGQLRADECTCKSADGRRGQLVRPVWLAPKPGRLFGGGLRRE